MKKKIRKAIEAIAEQLPTMSQAAPKYRWRKGAELEDWEQSQLLKNPSITEIDLERHYRFAVLENVPINHTRRMKRLYNEKGAKGIAFYLWQLDRKIRAHFEKVKQNEDSKLVLEKMATLKWWQGLFAQLKILLMTLFNMAVDFKEFEKQKKAA